MFIGLALKFSMQLKNIFLETPLEFEDISFISFVLLERIPSRK